MQLAFIIITSVLFVCSGVSFVLSAWAYHRGGMVMDADGDFYSRMYQEHRVFLVCGIVLLIVSIIVLLIGLFILKSNMFMKNNYKASLNITNEFVQTDLPFEERPETTPIIEEVEVRKGDEFNSFKVTDITDKSITIEDTLGIRYNAYLYTDDTSSTNLGEVSKFTISVGETLKLSEMDLLDADSRTTITLVEIV